MQSSARQKELARNDQASRARHFPVKFFIRAVAGAAVIAGFTLACHLNSQQQDQRAQNRPVINPLANHAPDANAQIAMVEQPTKQAGLDAASGDRKRQITDDSAKLLKLAGDLKAEVDKTSQDTLSLGVIRKADEIEKLARSVKEKMKLTISGN